MVTQIEKALQREQSAICQRSERRREEGGALQIPPARNGLLLVVDADLWHRLCHRDKWGQWGELSVVLNVVCT